MENDKKISKIEEINEKVNYCLNCKAKPCQKGCPLGNDIPTFIKCVKEEKYEEAFNVLSKTTVLQPICGLICPHMKQCGGSCIRGIKSNPVSIGDIESFVGNIAIEKGYEFKKENNIENKKIKVAIVGGGPSGLTAAAFLAKNNFDVTIYEMHEKLGGILRYGIPKFRLDKNILDNTINKILNLEIKVITSKKLGVDYSMDELEKRYNYVILAFGANKSSMMNISGKELDGVYGGNELLEYEKSPNVKNKNVAVIGGGNVAMDVARTLVKKGANVNVIYRRSEKEMPAEVKEIEAAKNEGVNFLFQNNILKIEGKEKVQYIECIKTKLVQKDGEKRLSPINIEGSNYKINTDYVIMAVGSNVEKKVVNSLGVNLNEWGQVIINEKYETSKSKVFACGDLAGIKSTVAWAARSGRDIAEKIIAENK